MASTLSHSASTLSHSVVADEDVGVLAQVVDGRLRHVLGAGEDEEPLVEAPLGIHTPAVAPVLIDQRFEFILAHTALIGDVAKVVEGGLRRHGLPEREELPRTGRAADHEGLTQICRAKLWDLLVQIWDDLVERIEVDCPTLDHGLRREGERAG